MSFDEIDRPPRNRRRLNDEELADIDRELEAALLATKNTTRALRVPLALFHSSPAKGRLWAKGEKVAHRVIRPTKNYVAAWVRGENDNDEQE